MPVPTLPSYGQLGQKHVLNDMILTNSQKLFKKSAFLGTQNALSHKITEI